MPRIFKSLKSFSLNAVFFLEKLYRKNKLNFTVVYFLGLIAGADKILSLFLKKDQNYWTEIPPLLLPAIAVLHFFFFILFKYIIWPKISFIGVEDPEEKVLFELISRGGIVCDGQTKGDLLCKKITFSGELSKRFEFPADDHSQRIAGEFNALTFMDTVWAGKNRKKDDPAEIIKNKIERNKAHLKRNPTSIILVKNTSGDCIGFAHVIPVTLPVWEKYFYGQIPDHSFPGHDVCGENEMPYGLIIFSIGSILKFSCKNLPRSITENISSEINESIKKEQLKPDPPYYLGAIYKAVLFQINEIITTSFPNAGIVPVLVQLEDRKLRKLFENNNFIKQPFQSADGYDIYMAHLVVDRSQTAHVV